MAPPTPHEGYGVIVSGVGVRRGLLLAGGAWHPCPQPGLCSAQRVVKRGWGEGLGGATGSWRFNHGACGQMWGGLSLEQPCPSCPAPLPKTQSARLPGSANTLGAVSPAGPGDREPGVTSSLPVRR